MNFVVYVIKNNETDKIYIGQTSDLENRLRRHNKELPSKKSAFTHKNSGNGRWEVVYQENFSGRSGAMKREKELKSFRGREFIKNYISAHSSVGRADAS